MFDRSRSAWCLPYFAIVATVLVVGQNGLLNAAVAAEAKTAEAKTAEAKTANAETKATPADTKPANPSKRVADSYAEQVLADHPVGYWRFSETKSTLANHAPQFPELTGKPQGNVTSVAGPRGEAFPDFSSDNQAAQFDGVGDYYRIADPGDESPLDFGAGDSITLEAWVNPRQLTAGRYMYIVGKGRLFNSGFSRDNQNYALRLNGSSGTGATVNFLFRGAKNNTPNDWHRWTSQHQFPLSSGWHHVAVTYTFGQPDSIRGYIDGRATTGTWDMGGATTDAPVVDNDEVWIGSSMGGAASNSFHGAIDEVALYRSALPAARFAERYHAKPVVIKPLAKPAEGEVVVEIVDVGVPSTANSWDLIPAQAADYFVLHQFAITGIPKKYNEDAVSADWPNPLLLRATGNVALPAGKHRLLLRSMGSARLFIDDSLAVQTGFPGKNSGGHSPVPELPPPAAPNMRPVPFGHREEIVEVELDGKSHVFRLEALIGGSGRRLETGELSLNTSTPSGTFAILSAGNKHREHTEAHWKQLVSQQRDYLANLDAQRRALIRQQSAAYWETRRNLAQQFVASLPEIKLPKAAGDSHPVDRFILAKLKATGAEPLPLADDLAFLRRVTLDTVGVIPTLDEIQAFLGNPPQTRREQAIERLLADPRWADHWVPYWQDVLAENPGLLKPKLNNTGPFRWWIHESFLDNKPLDRFVTEAVMMGGSTYYGGPAGFGMASQNDAPMAEKAFVLSKAFLGVDLRCARCHDAPYHPYKQGDTFHLAAMLLRGNQKIPATSSVPTAELARRPLVKVTLQAGTSLEPAWPLEQIVADELPPELLQNPQDSRARLAALFTAPANQRFAQVLVNRVWKRYLGRGFVEPVDDWFDASPSHPDLLDFLARDFTASGYDLKHLARQILTSQTYQRQVRDADDPLFSGPERRRLEAEQVVDSLHAAVGKAMETEVLTFDPDNLRRPQDFMNFGDPRRAWEFTSLSNERDRPALALPAAQSVVDVLLTFGWRDSRQDPVSVREQEPMVLQPLVLANGVLGHRLTRLSDNGNLVDLALAEQPLEKLIDQVFLQVLTREPTSAERHMFHELLSPSYKDRAVADAPRIIEYRPRHAISWSNHLHPDATTVKLELEELARRGDPATARLQADWRERMEDMVWALTNSPEFVFAP